MTKPKNPISAFFMNEASPGCNTTLGRAYARQLVAVAKREFSDMEYSVLLGYMTAWNDRSGSPFSSADIVSFLEEPPAPKRKWQRKPGAENFAEPLFGEVL